MHNMSGMHAQSVHLPCTIYPAYIHSMSIHNMPMHSMSIMPFQIYMRSSRFLVNNGVMSKTAKVLINGSYGGWSLCD